MRSILLLLALAGLVYTASRASRANLSAFQSNSEAFLLPLKSGDRIEQTFLSAHADRKAVWLFTSVPSTSSAARSAYSLTIDLASNDSAGENRATSQTIALEDVAAQPRLEIPFPAQPAGKNQGFRLVITTNAPDGLVYLYASREDRYLDGILKINDQTQSADLAFQVRDTDYPWNWFENTTGVLQFFGLGVLLFLLFAGIGSCILVLIGKPARADSSDWLVLSTTLGIGFVPVLYQLFALLNLPVTRWLLGLSLFVLLALAAGKGYILSRRGQASWKQVWNSLKSPGFMGLLLGLFLLSFALRTAQVRDLAAPSWGDGLYHFSLIERILADQGLPQGLLYHTGYHLLVVFCHSLFGGQVPGQMLVIGQFINALVGLSFFLLARKLLNNDWAGLLAACLIWFLAPFPTYLFNWGRYPFLLGLAMISPALYACLSAWKERGWRAYTLAGFLLLATVLCHYGMVSILLAFFVVNTLMFARLRGKTALVPHFARKARPRTVLVLALVTLAAASLLMLRFLPLLGGEKLADIVMQSRQAAQSQDYRELVGIAFRGSGALFGMFCLYGVGLAWQSNRKVLFLAAGWLGVYACLVAVFAPWLGESIASFANLIIFASLPLALLGGVTCARLLGLVPSTTAERRPPTRTEQSANKIWLALSQCVLFFVMLIFGGGSAILGQVNPATVLLTPADQKAMQWVQENVPAEAVFLINTAARPGPEAAPVDGGGWLQAMTSRQIVSWDTAPPPGKNPVESFPASWDYLYLGNGSGFIHTADLQSSDSSYPIIYQASGVTIYQKK